MLQGDFHDYNKNTTTNFQFIMKKFRIHTVIQYDTIAEIRCLNTSFLHVFANSSLDSSPLSAVYYLPLKPEFWLAKTKRDIYNNSNNNDDSCLDDSYIIQLMN